MTMKHKRVLPKALFLYALFVVPAFLGGCSNSRGLAQLYMPEPPKECADIVNGTDGKTGTKLFEVQKFPAKATSTGQVNVWLAKEGATRSNEHEISKVCAKYALTTAGVMADAEQPKELKKEKPKDLKTAPKRPVGIPVASSSATSSPVDGGYVGPEIPAQPKSLAD
jgi:hypothetical protein